MSDWDKSKWGDGPWESEPDEKRWKDWETGYQCLILRGPVGALCGYVGVPLDHPAVGKSYYSTDFDIDEIITGGAIEKAKIQKKINEIEVHGGLTYSGQSVPRDKDFYWFGFDCAHSGDFCPAIARVTHFDGVPYDSGDIYRDFAYVESQCTLLAKQLRAVQ